MKTNCIQWKVKVRWEDKKIKDTLLRLVVAWRKRKERGRGREERERREIENIFFWRVWRKERKKRWKCDSFIFSLFDLQREKKRKM